MAKKVILAVAGAGKTYHICNELDVTQRNLIIAFTNENIKNINNELLKKHNGKIPSKTEVLTFHKFIYRCFINPYEPMILRYFNEDMTKNKGVTIRTPEKQSTQTEFNPYYVKDNKLEHYRVKGRYHNDYLGKLLCKIKPTKSPILKTAIGNLNKYFDNIYIDEFQDFRKDDYNFLEKLIKGVPNITLVADYFQHSVSGRNNSGAPFKKALNFDSYISLLKKINLDVDLETLRGSRRCPENICAFVRKKLDIEIKSNNTNQGDIKFIQDEKAIDDILNDKNIMKLVFQEASKYKMNVINWGYSKGNTYSCTCIILTENFYCLNDENFCKKNIESASTINKLYVAITRTKGDLYFIFSSDFKKFKPTYLK